MNLNVHQLQRIVVRVPAAQAVGAMGEFNNWSMLANLMNYAGQDRWELVLSRNVDPETIQFVVWDSNSLTARFVRSLVREISQIAGNEIPVNAFGKACHDTLEARE